MIPTSEVRDGKHNGKTVWICHYNRPDLEKKALRNIPPTKVLICSNDELPKNKTVYYSVSHFRPIGKTGKPGSKVISPVDNTGYRMRSGNELFVFESEEECKASWNYQLQTHIERLDDLIENAANRWRKEKATLVEAIEG